MKNSIYIVDGIGYRHISGLMRRYGWGKGVYSYIERNAVNGCFEYKGVVVKRIEVL